MKRSPLHLIWLTVFVDMVGFGIIIPVLPFFATSHGATPADLGILLSIYSLMQFVFAPVLGSLSDRIGRKPVLAVSLVGTSIASAILGLAAGMEGVLWLLFVARAIDGVTGANMSTAQAYVADVTTPEKRGRGMALIGSAFGLGFILGPAIGGVLADADISLPFYFVSALALLNAALVMARLPEPSRHLSVAIEAKSRFSRLSRALRDPRTGLLLVILLIATVAFSAMEATLALLLAARFEYGPKQTGYLFVLIGVVIALVQAGLVGRLVDRIGERPLVVFGTLLLAVGLGALGLPVPPSVALLAGGLVVLGFGMGLYNPAITGLISRLSPASLQGNTLGVAQSMSAIGRVIGPVAGGVLFHYGWPLPYYFGAALMGVTVLLMIYYNATVSEAVPAVGSR
jgi:DHA1 family tetracycline resistance protein-like MFS transporter